MNLPASVRSISARAAGITAIVLLVSACGQRGPLYLPERPAKAEQTLQDGKLIENAQERAERKERQ